MKISRLFSVTFPLLLAFPAAAQYPDAVQVLVDEGLDVEASFDAVGGLTGFVGRMQGEPVTLYLLPDGEHVIVGKMLDGFGLNLSAQHLRQWLPEPDLAQVWEKLASANWVAEGPKQADRIVYAFTDPNCGYCQALHRKAQDFLSEGVQLRHIMVGLIHPSSMAKSASVISSDDPVGQLNFHEATYPADWLVSEENIPNDLRQQILSNHHLMETLGVSVTPTVFYRDGDGRVRRIDGLPDDSALAESVFRSQ